MATCPWCNAPRAAGPSCPRCGANYAKAEQIKAQGRAATLNEPPVVATLVGMEERAVEDPALELKLCAAAIPAALGLALVFHLLTPGLQRIFFGMPVHELGHAVTAWFCGYAAIPTLWRTFIPEERGFLAPLALAGALGYVMYRAWLAEKHSLVALGGALLVVRRIGTLGVRARPGELL